MKNDTRQSILRWAERTGAYKARAKGQQRVQDNSSTFARLKDAAVYLSQRNGSVTADELRAWAEIHDVTVHHHNVWGAIFRDRRWRKVAGNVSQRTEGHGNRTFRWRWDGGTIP